jgi:hypothetical protein
MAESEAITSAGSRLYISSTLPATYTKAGFEALTWTEVGEVTEIPAFGKVFNIVTFNPLGDRQTIKRKGSYDNGELDVPYAYDVNDDAGQVIMSAAVESDNSYAFKVDIKEDPVLKSVYFTAQVTSQPITLGGVDSIVMMNSTLAIDDDVLVEDPEV